MVMMVIVPFDKSIQFHANTGQQHLLSLLVEEGPPACTAPNHILRTTSILLQEVRHTKPCRYTQTDFSHSRPMKVTVFESTEVFEL